MKHNLQPIQLINLLPAVRRADRSRYLTRTIVLLSALLLSSCSQPPVQKDEPRVVAVPEVRAHTSGHLTNYGESRLISLADKLLGMNQSSHIIQLGDSHTAADFFTGALRTVLQQRYGNAGPGWLPPAWIRGQRSAALKPGEVAADQWQLTSSRMQTHPNFPLGGFLLQPLRSGSRLQLTQYTPDNTAFSVRALYQSPYLVPVLINGDPVTWAASENWQWSAKQHMQLPLTLETLDDAYPRLGGWLVENGQPGVLLSSLGINGATIHMLDKWGSNWQIPLQALQPDLLILAYGTNEAFNDDLDSGDYYATLTRHIELLRAQQPHAALLIIGAPDVIKHSSAETCEGRRPVQLSSVQAIQRQVAREQHTLFWDWQAMMGGVCSFSDWQVRGLAQKDGVHFTSDGYKASANAFYQDLERHLENLEYE